MRAPGTIRSDMREVVTALAGLVLGCAVGTVGFVLWSLSPQFPKAALPHAHAEAAAGLASIAIATAAPVQVPILVYHIVRPAYPSDSAELKKYRVTPELFNAELAHLRNAGYHVIGFQQLEAHFASSTPLPSKPVVLTLDDAWEDQYQYAFPILEQRHDTATFFVFTNAINSRGFLSLSDLKTMVAAGMSVGDHSKSHPYFAHLTATSSLVSQIVKTKHELEQQLGVPVIAFAYPFGQYNAQVLTYIKKAGFLFGRGDGWHGDTISLSDRYTLSALNAPTTLSEFDQRFP